MNVIPLLLFLLVASPSKAKGVDSLVYVGPIVNSVVVGSKTLEPEGDFFRAVLASSEYDPCLRVERVNVRAPNAPRVKASLRYCAVTFGKERLSLAASEQQDAELSNLSWKEFELSFDLSYVAIAAGATRQELRCTLDPRDGRNTILCAER
jgi:hypothetical protein